MKNTTKKRLGCAALLVTIVAIVIAPFAFMFGPFLYNEHQASVALKGLSSWTKEDCATVWEEAIRLCSRYPNGQVIEGNDVPEPLRRAGFRSAYVDESEFRAHHGGSSFGSTGGVVICWLKGSHGSEPYMGYSGGTYYPDGRWEQRR